MGLEMTHDDVREALAAEALGALDGDDADAVRAHLAECGDCRRELDELRAAAGSLAFAAPAAEMVPARARRVRARLLARARADRDASAGEHDGRVIPITLALSARSRRIGPGWLAAAAGFVLLVAAGGYAARLKGRYDELGARYAAIDADREQLARALARRDSTLAALSGPGVKVIDLASTARKTPSGRMFWNPSSARWTFFASNLPALRPGRDYQLWLITPAGPVSAGTFHPADDGQALVEATYRLPAGSLKAVAVTEEPAGGLPQPSGTPLILGTYGD